MTEQLSSHMTPEVTQDKMDHLWERIDTRRGSFGRANRRRAVWALAGGMAVAAGVLLAWTRMHGGDISRQEDAFRAALAQPAPLEAGGAALRTGNEQMAVDLADGSRLTVAPRTLLSMEETNTDDVALALQAGRVGCRVVKGLGRKFSIFAGPVTVSVVGTRFSVERVKSESGERVLVEVEEGIVEVSGPKDVKRRLSAGESWSLKIADPPPVLAPQVTAADGPPPGEAGESSLVKPTARAQRTTLVDLFDEARARRNTGDAAGAAGLYERFLRDKSSDPRAGVAALELGRLKMDVLGDVAGAVGPLTQAAARGAGGLADDALARLADAHARLGQVTACRLARSRYLRVYPAGVHIDQVRALCPN